MVASLFIEHFYFHMDSVWSFPLGPRMKLFLCFFFIIGPYSKHFMLSVMDLFLHWSI